MCGAVTHYLKEIFGYFLNLDCYYMHIIHYLPDSIVLRYLTKLQPLMYMYYNFGGAQQKAGFAQSV